MSATNPYLQERLRCGCIVTYDLHSGREMWKVEEQSKPCSLHIPGESISAQTVADECSC